jgi:hypothetical protein
MEILFLGGSDLQAKAAIMHDLPSNIVEAIAQSTGGEREEVGCMISFESIHIPRFELVWFAGPM